MGGDLVMEGGEKGVIWIEQAAGLFLGVHGRCYGHWLIISFGKV
jgi:hypothetical protein